MLVGLFGVAACSPSEGADRSAPALANDVEGPGDEESPAEAVLPWVEATIAIVDPRDHGAAGDGVASDTSEMLDSMAALGPDGGIVYLAEGLTFRIVRSIEIPGDHVKLWSINGQAEIVIETEDEVARQAIICRDREGCGFFGLRFRSDVVRRRDTLEDSQIVADGAELVEVVGVEVEGSASAALFFFGRTEEAYVDGNYLHDNWSDSIHFTNGSRRAWVWDNTIANGVEKGDDGIACVTYSSERLCGDMEWWGNTHLGDGWGRGYSVIGGEEIQIHSNFVRDVAGAGIIVASESSYGTEGSRNITIFDNVLFQTSRVIPHPGILVSGETEPIDNVVLRDNLVVDALSGEAVRFEGDTSDVRDENTSTDAARLPNPLPSTEAQARPKDTSILKTRDVSFVPPEARDDVYRVHVRRSPDGSGFEQGYEYVVAGPSSNIDRWSSEVGAVVTYRTGGTGEQFAVLFSPVAAALDDGLRPVGFDELRAGDLSGERSALWAALEPRG